MDEENRKSESSIARWMDAQRGGPGFPDALKSLLSYACAEWFRAASGAVLAPEEALSRIVLAGSPQYPVGAWMEHPEEHCAEIADFCEKVKSEPLPLDLAVPVPDVLDLRGVVCPGNAVRSRLVMSGYPCERVLKIALDEGSPVENVPGALVADGCRVVSREKKDGYWVISVVKPGNKKVN